VHDKVHPRAFWLKIEGAGTASPKVEFVPAVGGNLNPIEGIWIRQHDMQVGARVTEIPEPGQPQKLGHLVCKPHLGNGRPTGAFQVEVENKVVRWSGVKAPEIKDCDNASWHKGRPFELFNRKDLSGWQPIFADAALGWKVIDGLICCNCASRKP
jgi:hypothetical protein